MRPFLRTEAGGTPHATSAKQIRRTPRWPILLLVLALASAHQSEAGLLSFGSVTGFAHDLVSSTIESEEGVNANTLQVSSANLPLIGSMTSAPGVTTSATVEIVGGELKVFAESSAGTNGIGRATATARFNDTITLLDTAIYTVTAAPSWSLSGNCAADTFADATYSIELSLIGVAGLTASTCGVNSLLPLSFTFNGTASQAIDLTSIIGVRAYARGGVISTANGLNTGRFFLDGGSYVTASGNTYFSPAQTAVPEPSTWLLTASALGLIAVVRRRRK